MTAIFVCIVQPKVIEFNVTDQKLHRAQKDEELRSELDSLKLAPTDQGAADSDVSREVAKVLCQPGGGCRLLSSSPSVSVASVGSAVCVFEGSLSNAAALAEDYAPLPEDEPTPALSALSPAQLVCHMYAKVGVEALGLLRGSFTFVLYESKTSRVLAARDGSGYSPLFQARSVKGSLVLTNSGELLEACGCTDKVEFLPGDYKYGWSATPRRFQPNDHVRLSRPSLDLPTSVHHYHPHSNHFSGNGHLTGQGHSSPAQPGGSRNGSRRTSWDVAASAAGCPDNIGTGGRHHNRNNYYANQQHQTNGRGNSPQRPNQHQHQPVGSHLQRAYVVSAEAPRVVKTNTEPLDPQQTAASKSEPAAIAGSWSATAVAASPAAGGKPKDKGHWQEAAGNGRGSSARGVPAGYHNRRSSSDNHGGWKLGSGPNGMSAANRQSAKGQEQEKVQTPPKMQRDAGQVLQQAAGGPSVAVTIAGSPQQQHPIAPSGGKARGWESTEGRTPGKQQQQGTPSSQVVKPAVAGRGVTATPGTVLRVDAPEFVCTRTATVVGRSTPAAAVVGAVGI